MISKPYLVDMLILVMSAALADRWLMSIASMSRRRSHNEPGAVHAQRRPKNSLTVFESLVVLSWIRLPTLGALSRTWRRNSGGIDRRTWGLG